MSAYAGPDEYPIKQIPETPLWSENFAAMFTDANSGLAVMWSCGRWLADPTIWREFVMVSFSDGRFLYHRGYGRNTDAKGPGGCLSKYDIVEPGMSTHLRFDGPMTETTSAHLVNFAPRNDPPEKKCTMDLRFDSTTPIWNMKGDSAEAQKMIGGIHIDHIGTANGVVTYGGITYTMTNGYAVRDHSRGVRDMRHYGAHNWINGRFPNGRNFYLYAAAVQGSGELGMSNAMVEQDGRQFPATVVRTEVINSTEFAGKPHQLILQSQLGEMRVDITKVLNLFPYSMVVPFDTALGRVTHRPAAIIYDEFVSMRWDDVDGYGWSERGFTTQPLR